MDITQIFDYASTWMILFSLLAIYLYRKSTANFDFFVKHGIPGPKPTPIFGNMWGVWREDILEYDMRLVKKYGKTFGYFTGTHPNLHTVDPEIIKNILVKDFDRFVNRRDFQVNSYVFRKFVMSLKNQEWKDVRSAMLPTFTTAKIKRMSPIVKACAEDITTTLEKTLTENGGTFHAKKIFGSYAMDVIARCAFGMKVDNIGEGDNFTKNATVFFNNPINRTPAVILPFIFKTLSRISAPYIFVPREGEFFINVLKDLVNSRKQSAQKYHDFVEIMGEALAESVQTDFAGKTAPMWTCEEAEEVLCAQSIMFLLAGFDTTGTTLTNIFFLLAKHPDVQERLHNDICNALEENEDDVTHEVVNSIPYADQVINEALRLLPPAGRFVERECSKDVRYGDIFIPKGMTVTIPVHPLHHSDDFYPDPQQFDPDRWSPANKSKINPYAFLPFGGGPRNCIGMRFALEEIRFALCTILKKFRFYTVDDTPDQIPVDKGLAFVVQLQDFPLGAELR